MSIYELIIFAVALSMDAFAVAVCKGLNMKKINYRHAGIIALFFGGFQALMPFLGWFLGNQFKSYIENYDHWIAFLLLLFIGGKMAYEALKGEEADECACEGLNIKELFLLAVATSIDALAAGITLSIIEINIFYAISLIGAITFAFSFAGVVIGNRFGSRYQAKAEFIGGIVLILLGIKILLEHLGFIAE